ncbi:MAG: hypothetical protein PVI75_05820 [Gammaproteobacteria bacterium]|jgi:hypothetical protein
MFFEQDRKMFVLDLSGVPIFSTDITRFISCSLVATELKKCAKQYASIYEIKIGSYSDWQGDEAKNLKVRFKKNIGSVILKSIPDKPIGLLFKIINYVGTFHMISAYVDTAKRSINCFEPLHGVSRNGKKYLFPKELANALQETFKGYKVKIQESNIKNLKDKYCKVAAYYFIEQNWKNNFDSLSRDNLKKYYQDVVNCLNAKNRTAIKKTIIRERKTGPSKLEQKRKKFLAQAIVRHLAKARKLNTVKLVNYFLTKTVIQLENYIKVYDSKGLVLNGKDLVREDFLKPYYQSEKPKVIPTNNKKIIEFFDPEDDSDHDDSDHDDDKFTREFRQ